MRKILLLLSVMLFSLGVSAQKYFPEGTTWTWGYAYWGTPQGDYYRCVVEDDTIINDKAWKKVETYDMDGRRITGYDAYALHEEGDQIWVCYYDRFYSPEEEVFYYDFDWAEGKNVWCVPEWPDHMDVCTPNVPAIGIQAMQLADGNMYEYFGEEPTCDRLINTIGLVGGWGGLFPRYPDSPTNGCRYYMTSFVRNGVKIYSYDDATGIAATAWTHQADEGLFDLQGRRLTAEPAKGIFVRNGKKVVK